MLYKRILGASPLTPTSYLHAIKIFYWIAHGVQKNGKKTFTPIFTVISFSNSRNLEPFSSSPEKSSCYQSYQD